MDDKSRLKVGDLVRRAHVDIEVRRTYDIEVRPAVGIVIAIDRRHRLDDNVACVKWMDTTRDEGHWYPYQLQKVIKE